VSELGRCAAVRDRLDAMVAGELSAAEEARLATHLMRCADCAAELALADRVEEELHALPVLDAPPDLVARILAVPGGAGTPRAAWGGRALRPWPVALAALLAVAAGVGWWRVHVAPPVPAASVALQVPTQGEIAEATAEARLALAMVARVGNKARREVRDEILIERVAAPVLEHLGRAFAERGPTPPSGGSRS
jgi:anti-sigma factor RsiW